MFLFELSPLRDTPTTVDAYQKPIEGLPSIVTYMFSDVVDITTETQKVSFMFECHLVISWRSLSLFEWDVDCWRC